MALDANPASGTFNAYCDVAFADVYHGGRLHNDAYRCASTADKEAAIIWATRLFDTVHWVGIRTSPTQPQSWPRQGVIYEDRLAMSGSLPYGFSSVYSSVFLDPATVPVYVKNATAELALSLLANDTTAPAGTEGFSQIKIDTIELTIQAGDRQKWMVDSVYDLIYRFMVDQSHGLVVHKIST